MPVEQVIALVVKDARELADLSGQIPVPPSYNPVPSSTASRSIPSPLHTEQFIQLFMIPSRRSPSLFEKQAMGHIPHHANLRQMMIKHARGSHFTIVPPSPQIGDEIPFPSAPVSASRMHRLYPKTAIGTARDNTGETMVCDRSAALFSSQYLTLRVDGWRSHSEDDSFKPLPHADVRYAHQHSIGASFSYN